MKVKLSKEFLEEHVTEKFKLYYEDLQEWKRTRRQKKKDGKPSMDRGMGSRHINSATNRAHHAVRRVSSNITSLNKKKK